MTRFLLIRHASVEPIGKWLAGQQGGIHLNEKGQKEAQRMVKRLDGVYVDAVYSSPLERAQETAKPVAESKGLAVRINEALSDVDFGEWTSKQFTELERDPEWHLFNTCRATARIPGGESMADVLRRMVTTIEALREEHRDATVAVFSHCDPIRVALVHYAGMSLDSMQRLTVSPASISVLDLGGREPRILALNQVCETFEIAQG